MTDIDLLKKKLAFIETCLRDVLENHLTDLERFIAEIRLQLSSRTPSH